MQKITFGSIRNQYDNSEICLLQENEDAIRELFSEGLDLPEDQITVSFQTTNVHHSRLLTINQDSYYGLDQGCDSFQISAQDSIRWYNTPIFNVDQCILTARAETYIAPVQAQDIDQFDQEDED